MSSDSSSVQPENLVELLRDDLEAFNTWRWANLDTPLDLSDADLAGVSLTGAVLAGATMDRCILDDAVLTGALLSGASLVGASLRRADLRQANFSYAELISADIMDTMLGSALSRAADLSGACLAAARANEANFTECRLSEADLRDCDLRGAKLRRTVLEDEELKLPPDTEDMDGFWQRIQAEPQEVREGFILFATMIYLGSGQHNDIVNVYSAIAGQLEFSQAEVQALMPQGQIELRTLQITPPESDWARRTWFSLMLAMTSAAPIQSIEVEVLGHFGEQLGFSNRAMLRRFRDELGIDVGLT